MRSISSVSRYEAPESEVLVVSFETNFMGESNEGLGTTITDSGEIHVFGDNDE